jgi:hypothetical protein
MVWPIMDEGSTGKLILGAMRRAVKPEGMEQHAGISRVTERNRLIYDNRELRLQFSPTQPEWRGAK